MINRKHIERVLTINGVSLPASDANIRATLLGAHYREDEVLLALEALRSPGEATQAGDQSSMQKLIRTDNSLCAKEISNLLGIDIVLPRSSTRSIKAGERLLSPTHHVVIWSLAIIIAVLGVGLSMYTLDFGFFHPATVLTFYEHW